MVPEVSDEPATGLDGPVRDGPAGPAELPEGPLTAAGVVRHRWCDPCYQLLILLMYRNNKR